MKYLTINQILVIHREVIKRAGGSKDIRAVELLESAAARPQATFAQKDLYSNIFSKAAVLGYSIILNHPFIDGNKRVGYMAMRLFLNLNGYDIEASMEKKYEFVMEITQKTRKEEAIAAWLKQHSKKIGK
ncbi:type II toxin-antitoxin system death-on-curing family toxin [Candidatus Auribacterota bacterium]